ncbi:hypothetical protein QBC47DRAFT_427675 [Echria macrotheca]|uniref:Uncharacterized protein n=1 Tax=Echria macrotheca TaxID=438768 RepID=A0AAJ0FGT5_9PEZI|nr:hypothetical protein QBC47DRAFT_427675 [Echria macrotheca]
MKTFTIAVVNLLGLVSAQGSGTGGGSPSWTVSAVTPTGTGANGATPMCGQGFTYCGYILRDHQNFNEQDIVKAYCAGNQENCAAGKTKTDPIQALYICLPPEGQPVSSPSPAAHNPGTNDTNTTTTTPKRLLSSPNKPAKHHRRREANPPTTFLTSTGPPPSSGQSSGGGNGGDGNGNGAGGGNSCSSTETPGNRIELLCSCGNQCLNPSADHVGRCDVPCS